MRGEDPSFGAEEALAACARAWASDPRGRVRAPLDHPALDSLLAGGGPWISAAGGRGEEFLGALRREACRGLSEGRGGVRASASLFALRLSGGHGDLEALASDPSFFKELEAALERSGLAGAGARVFAAPFAFDPDAISKVGPGALRRAADACAAALSDGESEEGIGRIFEALPGARDAACGGRTEASDRRTEILILGARARLDLDGEEGGDLDWFDGFVPAFLPSWEGGGGGGGGAGSSDSTGSGGALEVTVDDFLAGLSLLGAGPWDEGGGSFDWEEEAPEIAAWRMEIEAACGGAASAGPPTSLGRAFAEFGIERARRALEEALDDAGAAEAGARTLLVRRDAAGWALDLDRGGLRAGPAEVPASLLAWEPAAAESALADAADAVVERPARALRRKTNGGAP